MPDTLLSMFPNLDDLLSLPPEELGRVILEIASGVMQNGMFNMAGLLAPCSDQSESSPCGCLSGYSCNRIPAF